MLIKITITDRPIDAYTLDLVFQLWRQKETASRRLHTLQEKNLIYERGLHVLMIVLLLFTIYLNVATFQNGRLDFFFYLAMSSGAIFVVFQRLMDAELELNQTIKGDEEDLGHTLTLVQQRITDQKLSTQQMVQIYGFDNRLGYVLDDARELMDRRQKWQREALDRLQKWSLRGWLPLVALLLGIITFFHAVLGFGRFIYRWSTALGGAVYQKLPEMPRL